MEKRSWLDFTSIWRKKVNDEGKWNSLIMFEKKSILSEKHELRNCCIKDRVKSLMLFERVKNRISIIRSERLCFVTSAFNLK